MLSTYLFCDVNESFWASSISIIYTFKFHFTRFTATIIMILIIPDTGNLDIKRMEEWFCKLESVWSFLLTALIVFRWMSFIPDLWFALAHIFPFFSTTVLHNFLNPSLRNLVYPDYELLICFLSFMYVTASNLQSPARNCCCSHGHVQDLLCSKAFNFPYLLSESPSFLYLPWGGVHLSFYHSSGLTSSFPLYQCVNLVNSGCLFCFTPLISSPTLTE